MLKHRLALTALAVVLLSTSGCYRIRYVNSSTPEALPAWEGWHHTLFYFWEVSGPIDVSRYCPWGFAEVESRTSITNILTAYPTNGLWKPQSVKVTCAAYSNEVSPPLAPPKYAP